MTFIPSRASTVEDQDLGKGWVTVWTPHSLFTQLPQLPELHPPEEEETEKFRFPETEKISPPLLQANEITFGYTPDKLVLKNVNFDVGLDSRVAIVGANGAGKSTLCVSLAFGLTLASSSY